MNISETKEVIHWGLRWIWVFIVISLVVTAIIDRSSYNRDNTDPPNDSRSGITLHIDDLTGCNYLATNRGGLTPRLNRDGEQVGCK